MKRAVKKKKRRTESGGPGGLRLTIADLVILSLLAERPMHGYDVNATLEDRKIRDWAAVSRPQIYYSLDKLTELGFIRVTMEAVSYTHLRAHETPEHLVCRLLLEKKK